ncbi:PAS domain-containing protein [candidate division KSB1 bacterium]|nr:PAS domain-containing protein [candidate division KSB1 bacterium]
MPQIWQEETISEKTAIPMDADTLRLLTFQIAKADTSVATFYRADDRLFIQARGPLTAGDIKKIREQVSSHAERLGWSVPETANLKILVNGKENDSYLHPHIVHPIKSLQSFHINFETGKEFIICIAFSESGIDVKTNDALRLCERHKDNGMTMLWSRLLESHGEYEALFRKLMDGVILCDEEEHILFINENAQKLTGMPEMPPIGNPLMPTALCDITEILREAIDNGLRQLNKVVRLKDNRTNLLGVHVAHVPDLENKTIGWLIMIRDITASWQSDQLRTIISIASHELKTPLVSMQSTLDLLTDEEVGEINSDQKRMLSILKDDIRHMQRMLHDLLDSTKIDHGKLILDRRRHVRIDMVANRVIESYSILAKSREIKLKTHFPPRISSFVGDRDRITQILMNLMDNAIKFSPRKSTISIYIEEQKKEILVRIADQGIGIPDDMQEKIFERFFKVDEHGGGHSPGFGLGLAIARDLIIAHGGKIWLESEIDKGTTFYFTVPLDGTRDDEKKDSERTLN